MYSAGRLNARDMIPFEDDYQQMLKKIPAGSPCLQHVGASKCLVIQE